MANIKPIVNIVILIVSAVLALAGLFLVWPAIKALISLEVMDALWFFIGTAACWALAALLYFNKEMILSKVP
jgi:divalent metal cation (Fe/Co/Zn/Cd) transporter